MKQADKTNIKSLDAETLQKALEKKGLPRYRADQVFQWLYQKGVDSFEAMTNLPKALREELDAEFELYTAQVSKQQESSDRTIKFLFQLKDGHKVEAVLIPEFFPDGVADRLTVCISSQVGCLFGCKFCATGKMGFLRHLSHGEIVDQLLKVNEVSLEQFGKKITNVVYMGMGEPLHNYQAVVDSATIICHPLGLDLSPRRITVSTVGLTNMIERLGKEKQPFNLAISLHAATDEKRRDIMPINKKTSLSNLKTALQSYYGDTQKPVTYEYLLFQQFNDFEEDAEALAEIASWIPSKINIIMYNNVVDVPLQRVTEARLDKFLRYLVKRNVRATVRRSRGDDIDAGCGQLAIREGVKPGKSLAGV